VTISGGEPLAQVDGVANLLRLAQHRGIHTAVETSGHAAWGDVERVLESVDLWLYDLKHLDPAAHRTAVGVSNRRILANLDRLLGAGAPVILRVPIIPTQNADDGFPAEMVAYVSERAALREIHLMPYNPLAQAKYETLGRGYELQGLQEPPEEMLRALKARLEAADKTVRIGG
jgi:pyruvate formate lyase activating enzyme